MGGASCEPYFRCIFLFFCTNCTANSANLRGANALHLQIVHRTKDIAKVEITCTFYLSVNVFSTKVLFGDTIFYVSNWRRDRHFTWSSEPREGLACCSAKGVPSFLSCFKTLSIGPAPGIEPATSRSAVNTLYEVPPKRKFKECYGISRFGQLVCYEICKTSGAWKQHRKRALNKRKQTK